MKKALLHDIPLKNVTSNEDKENQNENSQEAFNEDISLPTNIKQSPSTDVLSAIKRIGEISALAQAVISITQKLPDDKRILLPAVKLGGQFVQTFLKQVTTLLSMHFHVNPIGVRYCLKCVQKISRQLTAICDYAIAMKDPALIPKVPAIRRLVENFTYTAASIYLENKCFAQFSTGHLRRRGIDGQIIDDMNQNKGIVS